MAGWSCQGNNEYLCVFLRCPAATLWLYMLFTVFHGANSSSATVSQTRRWNMTHSVSFVPAFRRLSRNVRGCVNKKCRDSTAHILARKLCVSQASAVILLRTWLLYLDAGVKGLDAGVEGLHAGVKGPDAGVKGAFSANKDPNNWVSLSNMTPWTNYGMWMAPQLSRLIWCLQRT